MHLGNPRRYFGLPQIPTKHGLKAGPFNKPHLWPCGFSTFFSTVFEEVCEAQGEEGDCGFEDQGDCEAQDCEAQGDCEAQDCEAQGDCEESRADHLRRGEHSGQTWHSAQNKLNSEMHRNIMRNRPKSSQIVADFITN